MVIVHFENLRLNCLDISSVAACKTTDTVVHFMWSMFAIRSLMYPCIETQVISCECIYYRLAGSACWSLYIGCKHGVTHYRITCNLCPGLLKL